MARKLLLALVVATIAFGALVGGVFAQDEDLTPEDQRLILQYKKAIEKCAEPSLECLVHYTVNYVAIELTDSVVKIDNVGIQSGGSPGGDAGNSAPHADNPVQGGVEVAQQRGVVPALAYYIGAMYANPPANTHYYVADLMDSVDIAQPAYAQALGGLGYGSLSPILTLWKTFRNIAYMFYIFLFIVIGFLIMFRKKVGSAAITAQQAIPSIIISLIFVTFSYAISGLLIDAMYVVMYLILGMFKVTFDRNADIINYDIFNLSWTFLKRGAVEGNDLGRNVVEDFINNILSKDSLVGEVFGWIGGITVGLVIAVAVLIGSFKLFFELLRSYATIVLSVVVAPIQLMLGAIPGNNAVMPWLKNMIANLSAFPVVLMVAVMFYLFTDGTVADDGGFMPPFLVGRGQAGAITNLMGLAILLAMPEIVKEVKKKLGASEGFGGMIVSAAGARAGKGADLSLPAVLAAPDAVGSGITGGIAAARRRDMRTPRGILRGAIRGVDTIDPATGEVTGYRGGMFGGTGADGVRHAGGFQRGWSRGQTARKWIDDIRDGRFLQPDNTRRLIENLAGTDKKKSAPPRASVPDGG